MTTDNLILALDFGGTKLSAAVTYGNSYKWLGLQRVITPANADGKYEYIAMLELAYRLTNSFGKPSIIGVSFGGPVDSKAGIVHLSHHVANWENIPLQAQLQNKFAVPVVIDNDANMGALAEYKFGAGRGCDSLLYVTVSTGIGSGWIINGKPYNGFNGMAGEIGHIVVNPRGMPCACGKQGCLEAEACGPAIAKLAKLAIEMNPTEGRELLNCVNQSVQRLTAKHVNEAANMYDPLANTILNGAGHFLGKGLAVALNLMNPQRIILGGGVAKSGDAWWQSVRETAREFTIPEIPVDIVPTELGDDAPLWGAIALAKLHL